MKKLETYSDVATNGLDLITWTDHPQRYLMVARIQVMVVFDLPRCVKSAVNMVLGD
jgi:hypothetical protein